MTRRVFLHVGTPKTGTTFLQSVLWANRSVLAEQGVLLPLDTVRDHFYLSNIARDAKQAIKAMPDHAATVWPRALAQLKAWDGDAVISHELFAPSTAARARWTLDQLRSAAAEVHTIVTARDLARQVPAEWQQTVKHGRSHTLRQYYGLLRADEPSVIFWSVQDLDALMAHWSQGIPREHAHLVTVPPAGGPRHLLWERYASVIGIDPASVDQSVNRPNESLGLEEIETLRRINEHAPADFHRPGHSPLVRAVLADGVLASRPDPKKFAPPVEEHPWVLERGTAMIDALRSKGYDVVGDLDELLPPSEPLRGPLPDDVDDSAVAAVAVETTAALLYGGPDRPAPLLRMYQVRQNLAAKTRRVENLEQRVQTLENRLATAWAAYERERTLPLWKHAGRRVRALVRRSRPGSGADGRDHAERRPR